MIYEEPKIRNVFSFHSFLIVDQIVGMAEVFYGWWKQRIFRWARLSLFTIDLVICFYLFSLFD
jgi:hypothetical protein